MKTLKNWLETEKNFKDFVQVGEEVDEEMVDYFMNVLPPRSMSAGYLQVGEPYSHIEDKADGRWKATYDTFIKEDGRWIYKGHCFAGSTENQTEVGNPWDVQK